jgi:hypothetical protein
MASRLLPNKPDALIAKKIYTVPNTVNSFYPVFFCNPQAGIPVLLYKRSQTPFNAPEGVMYAGIYFWNTDCFERLIRV